MHSICGFVSHVHTYVPKTQNKQHFCGKGVPSSTDAQDISTFSAIYLFHRRFIDYKQSDLPNGAHV